MTGNLSNREVVLRFMEGLGTNNAELVASCIGPDTCAITKGYGRFAGSRPAEAIVGMIDAFNKMVPGGLNFTIIDVTGDGDRIAVEAEGNAMTAAGTPYRNQYCFVFSLRDGLIRQVNEYFCSVHADEVLWPLVEQTREFRR